MRLLGPLLVITAIMFSTGGVAYQSVAEPAASTEAAAAEAAEADPGQCRVDAAGQRAQPGPIDISELAKRKKPGFRALSGTGYNYPVPGTWHPDIATRKQAPAPEAPAAPAPAN